MKEKTSEMLEHLDNILVKVDLLSEKDNSELKYNLDDLEKVKNTIIEFKYILKNEKNIILIDLKKLKEISNIIFELNSNNLFSEFTDYISNELYAFEFLLQEKIKKKGELILWEKKQNMDISIKMDIIRKQLVRVIK